MKLYLQIIVISIITSALAMTENNPGMQTSGGWKAKPRAGEKITRFEGNILSVDAIKPGENDGEGFHLRMQIATGEELRVHLGPQWIQFQHDFNLTHGQPIVVVGLTFQLEKGSEFRATEVSQKDRRAILDRAVGMK